MRRVQEKEKGGDGTPRVRQRVYWRDSGVAMETYPSACARCFRFFSSIRVAARLFPPSSFVPRRASSGACAKNPSHRVYKHEPRLFLVVPPDRWRVTLCGGFCVTRSGRCELKAELAGQSSHHVALRAVRRR